MVQITRHTGFFMAEVVVNGMFFNETRATALAAFIAISEAVEFEFGQVVSLGIEYK